MTPAVLSMTATRVFASTWVAAKKLPLSAMAADAMKKCLNIEVSRFRSGEVGGWSCPSVPEAGLGDTGGLRGQPDGEACEEEDDRRRGHQVVCGEHHGLALDDLGEVGDGLVVALAHGHEAVDRGLRAVQDAREL